EAVGIALAFSIILGIAAVVGSLIPFIRLHPEKIFTAGGAAGLAGIALVLVWICVCAVAGWRGGTAFGGGPPGQTVDWKGALLLSHLRAGLGPGELRDCLRHSSHRCGAARGHLAPLGAKRGVAALDVGRRHPQCRVLHLFDEAKQDGKSVWRGRNWLTLGARRGDGAVLVRKHRDVWSRHGDARGARDRPRG